MLELSDITSKRHLFWQWSIPILLSLFIAIQYGVCTQDDAFISFRYAENMASGNGLVFNIGEKVEGFSNPLWTFLFVLGAWLGADPVITSVLLGYCSVIFLGYAGYALSNALHVTKGYHWLIASILLIDPSMLLEGVQGLESVLYAGLITLAVAKQHTEKEATQPTFLRSTILWMLASITRPEAPLLYGLSLFALYETKNKAIWKAIRQSLQYFVVFLLCVTSIRFGYYGDILPNTFYAKVGGLAITRGLRYCWQHMQYHPILWMGIIGGIFQINKKTLALYVLFWGYILYIIAIGGDFKPTGRFILPMNGIMSIASVMVFVQLLKKNRGALVCIVLLHCVSVYFSFTQSMVWAIDRSNNLQARRIVGEWLEQHTHPDTVLAIHSVGVIPYYAKRKTIDMWGLTNREIAKTPTANFGTGMAGHEKSNPIYVFSLAPDIYLPEDNVFQPKPVYQQVETGFPPNFADTYTPFSVQIEGSWLNIWKTKDYKFTTTIKNDL
jgi:hypothetical protein